MYSSITGKEIESTIIKMPITFPQIRIKFKSMLRHWFFGHFNNTLSKKNKKLQTMLNTLNMKHLD